MTDTKDSTAWMQTHSGQAFDLINPDPATVDPDDIAHALSQLCRYAGHTRVHYSVAEHCCLLHDHLEERRPKHPAYRLGGLLHDAPEFVVVDIPAPVKFALSHDAREGFRRLEDGVREAICTRLDVPEYFLTNGFIKDADRRILLDERAALLGPPPKPWGIEDMEPLGVTIEAWPAARAKAEWLKRLYVLRPGLVR